MDTSQALEKADCLNCIFYFFLVFVINCSSQSEVFTASEILNQLFIKIIIDICKLLPFKTSIMLFLTINSSTVLLPDRKLIRNDANQKSSQKCKDIYLLYINSVVLVILRKNF